MKHTKAAIGLAALVFFSGCASTDEVILDNTKRTLTTAVEIFKDGKMPEQKFKEVAELSILGPREDELRAERRFISQARQMDGNGVIFTVTGGSLKGGGTLFQTVAYIFKGKVIVYE